MPIYFFWGEDDYAIATAVKQLQKSVLDPNWLQFNYDKLFGEQPDNLMEALNLAMTPVFGMGERLIWLADTTICQHCPENFFKELERTLPQILETSHLLFTSSKKPDQRLKSAKFLAKYGQFREFSFIPPWQTDELIARVSQVAQEIGVKLTPAGTQLLAESVGNNTRQLWSELEKLKIYSSTSTHPLDVELISTLVCDSFR
ncbi:MAG: DNA polymerase III subunit delta [Gomphosphaeria aponina SAG 52.96 = DSM 107014]|uniref:DNA polymerase III subunit delta n=1 Tax=Gomphosphaeria aponina SAG 52.96 = DSM 107014 TaxID=1521640 RepID=A0A941GTQ1_9CHRO|nr:DNA polymerase III subunit delta [Gomphosphaeria aponina SAG 52.96 = DSM 107014]